MSVIGRTVLAGALIGALGLCAPVWAGEEHTLDALGFGPQPPLICSIEMRLSTFQAAMKWVRSVLPAPQAAAVAPWIQRWFARNPNVYFVVRAKREVDHWLVPQLHRQARGRKVLSSFLLPSHLAGKEILVEIWDDCSDSDDFWKAVAAATKVRIHGELQKTSVLAGKTKLEIEVRIDGNDIAKTTLADHVFLGEYAGTLPANTDADRSCCWP